MRSLSQSITQRNDNGVLYARLLAIDAEMEADASYYLHRKITIRRGDIRIDVFINRDRSQHGYYGSCRFNGKSFSSWGKRPRHAAAKLIKQLEWEFARVLDIENPSYNVVPCRLGKMEAAL